ncbi:MAG: hypothetical protein ABR899_02445, partial [Candidatus Krumholzibacteriaceae bacterium]
MNERADRARADELAAEAGKVFAEAGDLDALEEARIRFIARKGEITALLRSIGSLPPEERPGFGDLVNDLKARIQELYEKRKAALTEGSGEEDHFSG